MRMILCITLYALMTLSNSALAQEVQGDTLTLEGRQVVYMWGTHTERGYAYGYLLGEPIRAVFEEYFLEYYLGGSATLYNYLRNYFETNFTVEAKYHQEAAGMIDGMLAAGNDIYCDILGRDMEPIDVLVVNSIVDYAALSREPEVPVLPNLGCSSISSWGTATADDSWLDGALVFTRFMDWTPHSVLHANHLLVIHFPSEEDEQAWVSFTFPGLIGALSAVNEAGVGAFLNMGNYHTGTPTGTLHPALLTLRNALEAADYNNTNGCTVTDIVDALSDKNQLSGFIVHAMQAQPGDPCVIEGNCTLGQVVRNQTDNTVLPGDNLVATNHFRQLYPPVWCYRYSNIVDSLTTYSDISATRQWELLGGAAGSYSNLHAIQYTPGSGRLLWGASTATTPGFQVEPAEFYLGQLLELMEVKALPTEADSNMKLQLYPNPGNAEFRLQFTLQQAGNVRLTIHDLLGRELHCLVSGWYNAGQHSVSWQALDKPAGLYIASLSNGKCLKTQKLLLLK